MIPFGLAMPMGLVVTRLLTTCAVADGAEVCRAAAVSDGHRIRRVTGGRGDIQYQC
jgi:hypothetical protein